MKVKAKTATHPTPVECEVNIPATLAEKVKAFGEDVVNAASEDSLIITAQALIRRLMTEVKDKAGKVTRHALSVADIQKKLHEWKPDVRSVVRQSALEKATSAVSSMSEADRAALMKKLQELHAAQSKKAA